MYIDGSNNQVDFLVDFSRQPQRQLPYFTMKRAKRKSIDNRWIINAFLEVGMTGFEPATSRPPDVYSNRTELHPELRVQRYVLFLNLQHFGRFFFQMDNIVSEMSKGICNKILYLHD